MPKTKIVWVYDTDHLEHPFIPLAADSLFDCGYHVTVIDNTSRSEKKRYNHLSYNRSILFQKLLRQYKTHFNWIKKITGANESERFRKLEIFVYNKIFLLFWLGVETPDIGIGSYCYHPPKHDLFWVACCKN